MLKSVLLRPCASLTFRSDMRITTAAIAEEVYIYGTVHLPGQGRNPSAIHPCDLG